MTTAALKAPFFPTVVPKPRRLEGIDPEHLKVEHNVPLPGQRGSPDGKFHPVFRQLKAGSCVRCEAAEMNAIANALRKGIKTGKYPAIKDCIVRSSRCTDGHGRVWAIKG